jgi:uncharacterized membrane protein
MGRLVILLLLAAVVAYFMPAPVTHFDSAVEIDASREKVWDLMSDFSQLSRWNDAVDSTVFLSPERKGEGTQIRLDGPMLTTTLKVVHWQPYNDIGFAVILNPRLTYDHVLRYSIQKRFESRTVVRVEEEYHMAGGYLGHVFGKLLFDRMRDSYRTGALGLLKRLAETGVGLGT